MLGPANRAPPAAAAPPPATASSASSASRSPDNFKGPACKRAVIGLPRHLSEWIETESMYDEVISTGNNNKPRRYVRNPSVGCGSGVGKHLVAIREGKIIPRPIWPSPSNSTGENSPDTGSSDAERDVGNRKIPSLCGSGGYRSSCEGSNSDYSPGSSGGSARELLLELSRTLSSVLEGDCDKTDEEILRDISRTVAQGAALDRHKNDDEVYRSASLSSGRESNSTIGVNPINSRLYGRRCYGDKRNFYSPSHPSSSREETPPKFSNNGRNGESQRTPSIYLLPDERTKSFFQASDKSRGCTVHGKSTTRKQHLPKQLRGQTDEKDSRFNYPSKVEHEYTTLECSDETSSSEGVTTDSSVKTNSWCTDFRGFDKDLDFTLDGLKAERLRYLIARAKRRRQWCRAILVILGLVFFILTVVVVSLSVTRGRKIFGSM